MKARKKAETIATGIDFGITMISMPIGTRQRITARGSVIAICIVAITASRSSMAMTLRTRVETMSAMTIAIATEIVIKNEIETTIVTEEETGIATASTAAILNCGRQL